MSYRLQSRYLYLADLARRQYEMESGQAPMNPLAYRVVSKALRKGLAGLPASAVLARLPGLPPELLQRVAHVLEMRHFEQHGALCGEGAMACREAAYALLNRLR